VHANVLEENNNIKLANSFKGSPDRFWNDQEVKYIILVTSVT